MEFLLDTHTFLWALLDTKQLGSKTTEILLNRKNRCFLSIASIDRILIATAIRKGFTILSKDEKFEQYKSDGLQLLW